MRYELARVFTYGAKKYGKDNWKKVDKEKYIDALKRHTHEIFNGKFVNYDDGGLLTIAQIALNAFAILWHLNKEEKTRENNKHNE